MTATRTALAVLAAAGAAAAAAQTPSPVAVWLGSNSGSWFEASNWSGGVPGASTAVIIDRGSAVVPQSTAPKAGGLFVGTRVTGQVAGLGLSSRLDVARAVVGVERGSSAIVTIGRGGALAVDAGGLEVGAFGTGEIVVSSGGGLGSFASLGIGTEVGGHGTLRATGGTLVLVRSVDLGSRGVGVLSLAGGSFLNGRYTLLQLARLGGTAEFRISRSWAWLGGVEGHAGGSVLLEAGGVLDAVGIDVGGSSWSLLAGSSVRSDEEFNLADGSRLAFTLSDHGPAGAGRVDGRSITLDGTLAVALGEGFVPAPGDQWQLLGWRDVRGRFDHLELPTLAPSLRWDTSALYTTGTLQVAAVPEPASAALLAAGALLLGWRLRRPG